MNEDYRQRIAFYVETIEDTKHLDVIFALCVLLQKREERNP